MPSSTSSSEARIWLLAVAIVIAVVGVWEALVRASGIEPTLHRSRESWQVARSRVHTDSTVFLGSSRIQSALDPIVWTEIAGGEPPIHLSNVSQSPLPVLEHLAHETPFAGLAILDLIPLRFFGTRSYFEASSWAALERWREASPSRRIEAHLDTALRSHLAWLAREASPAAMFNRWWHPEAAPPLAMVVRRDRFRVVDWEGRSLDVVRNDASPDLVPTPEGADEHYARLEAAVRAIHEREGKVVIVRFPVSGETAATEAQLFPREEFWDVMAARSSARTIHFRDFPQLSSFELKDGSHLEWEQAKAFTRALAALVTAAP